MSGRIYFDHAATSWPKPEAVYLAVDRYQRECGAPAGRSVYREAQEATRIVAQARRQVADLLHVHEAQRIIFTLNGTDALNLAIHGIVRPGEHVVTTVVEHNSVLRPLRFLEEKHGVSVSRVACDERGMVRASDVQAALRSNTRLVAVIHASNVTGAIQPIEEIGRLARANGSLMLVDAAQSLGHIDLDVSKLPIDLLAAPGHKGLLGPLGTGLLYVGSAAESTLIPLRQGGTGTQSELDRQPDALPERLESGNLNVAGLAGLAAGVAWIREQGVEKLRQAEQKLTEQLVAGLEIINGITVFGPKSPQDRTGVVSFAVNDYDPQEVAAALDTGAYIQVRSGLHCAPLVHRRLGTSETGGTVRIGIGPFNTSEQIELALAAIHELTRGV